jgi:DNA-binding Lrp family transcriptional regulator
LDTKDVRIFCEMAFKYLDYNALTERHVSASDIGKKLGLDEKTVRLRVKKMEEDGFIKYYEAIPNPGLFGQSSIGMYNFQTEDIPSKFEAVKYIQRSPWVLEAFDAVGPTFSVTLVGASQEQLQQRADEMSSKLGIKAGIKFGDRVARPPLASPTKLDWQILLKLRYDAVCPTKEIADSLSITPRMAEYRITRLLETGVFFIRALINAQRQRGLTFYGILLFVDETRQSSVVREMRELHGEKVWFVFNPMAGVVLVNLFGFSSGEPEDALMKALKLEGVRQGSFSLFKELIEPQRPNWIDNLIVEKISGGT